jgi:hypothetical protein
VRVAQADVGTLAAGRLDLDQYPPRVRAKNGGMGKRWTPILKAAQ